MKPGEMVLAAEEMATKWHFGQMYGDVPYIEHLRDVAKLVKDYRVEPAAEAGAVAFLHDILEDTEATPSVLAEFPHLVLAGVMACTDPVVILPSGEEADRKERKRAWAQRMAKWDQEVQALAKSVKCADRLANLSRCTGTGNIGKLRMYYNEFPDFMATVHDAGCTSIVRALWDAQNYLRNEVFFGGKK